MSDAQGPLRLAVFFEDQVPLLLLRPDTLRECIVEVLEELGLEDEDPRHWHLSTLDPDPETNLEYQLTRSAYKMLPSHLVQLRLLPRPEIHYRRRTSQQPFAIEDRPWNASTPQPVRGQIMSASGHGEVSAAAAATRTGHSPSVSTLSPVISQRAQSSTAATSTSVPMDEDETVEHSLLPRSLDADTTQEGQSGQTKFLETQTQVRPKPEPPASPPSAPSASERPSPTLSQTAHQNSNSRLASWTNRRNTPDPASAARAASSSASSTLSSVMDGSTAASELAQQQKQKQQQSQQPAAETSTAAAPQPSQLPPNPSGATVCVPLVSQIERLPAYAIERLKAVTEPQRAALWLKLAYNYSPGSYTGQKDIWLTYSRHMEDVSQVKYAAVHLITLITSVSPEAIHPRCLLPDGSKAFVVQNIQPRSEVPPLEQVGELERQAAHVQFSQLPSGLR